MIFHFLKIILFFQKKKKPNVFGINTGNIKIGNQVTISPGVVLDASHGPIIIADNVNIMAQATVIGPCFIGNNSLIKVGAKIYEKTSIGEWCKVGGEVENSIFQSYSNKQHDGFLGQFIYIRMGKFRCRYKYIRP